MQVYFTHNNGGRPYKVEIYQTNPVKIFQLADDEDDEDDENKSRHAEDDGDDDEVKYTYAMETKAEKIFVLLRCYVLRRTLGHRPCQGSFGIRC